MKPFILDCTLRDGGYVNNWEFDTETARSIMAGLYAAGVRYIEIGILGTGAKAGKQTKFNDFSEMEPLLESREPDCRYAVMFTQENAGNFEFPVRGRKTPDLIRLAYFKKNWQEALDQSTELKQKGYDVFLQAMATFMYEERELEEMLSAVNALAPAAFYMVDSFSTMYPDEVAQMRDYIAKRLSPQIALGFHAHNNIQMAYANVREFLNSQSEHVIFVDGSIFGMGRGAGNVPLELLMEHCNRFCDGHYNIGRVLSLYQEYLEPIFRNYRWGYALPYFLTASRKINSAYGWYFTSHGITNLGELDRAFAQIPLEISYTLQPAIANEIIGRLREHENQ